MELNSLEGVEHIETNLKEGAVVVTMREAAMLDQATAKKAIKCVGFNFDGFEQIESGQ